MPQKVCGQAPTSAWEPVPTFVGEDGHVYITMYDAWGRGVVRMMAEVMLESFVGPRPSPLHRAHHKNGVKQDNYARNLEWKLPSIVPESSFN